MTTTRDVHVIRTPENVTFEFTLAGVGARAVAASIDLVAMVLLLSGAAFFAQLVGLVSSGFANALYFILAFTVQWGYGAFFEWRFLGQTLGKHLLGIRVITLEGMTISFAQSAVRNLVRVVDLMPAAYLVGGVCALLDTQARRLGDIAAGTVVVQQRKSPRPSHVIAASERYNSLESDPHVIHAAERITAPERDAMIDLALRRDRLPLGVRHSLFTKLATHLERRLGLSRPTYVSEERFVLNVAAIALGAATNKTRQSAQRAPTRAG